MPGKIANVLQPAVAAALAALLLQACPDPSTVPKVSPKPSIPTVSPPPPPQPTITKETIKDKAGNTIGTITVKKDAKGKPVSRILTVSPSLTALPASAFANRGITAVTIPSKVTSIGNRAFAGNRLTALTIPRTVTTVGAEAFKGNPGLKSVIISQGLLNKTSADTFPASAVFTDHGSKVITRWVSTETTDADGSKITLVKDNNGRGRVISKTLELSSTVTAVPASKFANKQLTAIRIPPETTSIGNQAFTDNKLTELTIPSTVTSIGTEAFKGNPGLKLVNISPQLLDNTSPNAFPAGVDFKDRLGGITRITTNAAGTTITAKSLEIPKSLTAIPNGSGTTGTYSAIGLTSLSFVLPSSLTSIGQNAFRDNRFTAVTIPNTVTRIGVSAFSGNPIASIRIPDSVTDIEAASFSGSSITTLVIGNKVETIGPLAFRNNQITTSSTTPLIIPTTVTSIGALAFDGNTGLTAVTISRTLKNNTTAVPANAFPTGVTFTDHSGVIIP